MTVLGKVAGQALQDDLFPATWTEKDFQDKMRSFFRDDPRIGSELEDHPHAAGGITDLSFRRMRIELKVERDRYVELEDARQYFGQTTQYVAGSDGKFGVLCILDCSKKESAPGSVSNDIALVPVAPPGGGQGTDILIGIVVIRGNLPAPSSWSKN